MSIARSADDKYEVDILDDLQWAIFQVSHGPKGRRRSPVSFHQFSDSLRRRWTEFTGEELTVKLPEHRRDFVDG